MTARPNILRPSRREVKNDVWKYLQIIVIGLCAVCGRLLDDQDRALTPRQNGRKMSSFRGAMGRHGQAGSWRGQ